MEMGESTLERKWNFAPLRPSYHVCRAKVKQNKGNIFRCRRDMPVVKRGRKLTCSPGERPKALTSAESWCSLLSLLLRGALSPPRALRYNYFPLLCCHSFFRIQQRVLGAWMKIFITCCLVWREKIGVIWGRYCLLKRIDLKAVINVAINNILILKLCYYKITVFVLKKETIWRFHFLLVRALQSSHISHTPLDDRQVGNLFVFMNIVCEWKLPWQSQLCKKQKNPKTKMELGGHEEVCLMLVPPMNFWTLEPAMKPHPGHYYLLTMATRPPAHSTLKGANPFSSHLSSCAQRA